MTAPARPHHVGRPAPTTLTYLVCAATVADAHAWADQHDIPRKRTTPVTPHTRRHLNPGWLLAVVRVRSFFDLPARDQDRIEALTRQYERKRPRA